MFVFLCIVVCLATVGITWLASGLLVHILCLLLRPRAWQTLLGFPLVLFALRILPLTMSATATLAFVLPSFLLLEPRYTSEKPEGSLFALAFAGGFLVIAVAVRFVTSLLSTRRLVRNWLLDAQLIDIDADVAVYRIESPESVVALTGIFHPRVFIGKKALEVLDERELRAALAHEIEHARSLDNLKQLLLNATRLPRLFNWARTIEAVWWSAAELKTDRRTVDSGISPLDLGAALVKIARITSASNQPTPAISHLLPTSGAAPLRMRVHQLERLIQARTFVSPGRSFHRLLWPVIIFAGYLSLLPITLPLTQRGIEWLVR